MEVKDLSPIVSAPGMDVLETVIGKVDFLAGRIEHCLALSRLIRDRLCGGDPADPDNAPPAACLNSLLRKEMTMMDDLCNTLYNIVTHLG